MKTKSKTEAKKLAKAYSYNNDFRGVPIYIIYCNRSDEKAEHCREFGTAKLKNQESWEDI